MNKDTAQGDANRGNANQVTARPRVGLFVTCLVDLIRARSVRYLPKPVWALIIVLGSVPLGALAYLLFGRDRHGHDPAEPAGGYRSAGPADEDLVTRR